MARFVRRLSPATVMSAAALFIALGGTTYAATGGNFLLGKSNSAGATSALSSGVTTGPTLALKNTGGKPAASFTSNTGVAPFTVSNGTKVAGLNADRLDGVDSSSFLRKTEKAADSDLLDGTDSTELMGARAYALVQGCSGSPTLFCGVEGKNVAYVAEVAEGRYCVGVNGIAQNVAGNVALVQPRVHAEYGIWLPNSACVASEFEVETYHITSEGLVHPDEMPFVIVIP